MEEFAPSYDLTVAEMCGLVEIVQFHRAHDNHVETYYEGIQLARLMGHLAAIKEFMKRNCPVYFAPYLQGRVPLYCALQHLRLTPSKKSFMREQTIFSSYNIFLESIENNKTRRGISQRVYQGR